MTKTQGTAANNAKTSGGVWKEHMAKEEVKKPMHLAKLPAQRLERYKALLNQAQKKEDGRDITDNLNKVAGQATTNFKGTKPSDNVMDQWMPMGMPSQLPNKWNKLKLDTTNIGNRVIRMEAYPPSTIRAKSTGEGQIS